MPKELFEVVCVPLMGVNHTVTLGISTPDDENNYYSELFNIKLSDGTPLFKTVPIGLACEKCINKGKADKCRHRLGILPAWKSEENQELQRMILGAEIFRREAQAEVMSSVKRAFRANLIKAWFEAPRIRLSPHQGSLFIAIDPTGGGIHSSEMAIVAGVLTADNMIVVRSSLFVFVFMSCCSSTHELGIR